LLKASSNDDALERVVFPISDERKPWWATDPELQAFLRRDGEEFQSECNGREPVDNTPDPVVGDFFSGASLRELAFVRDDFARARARYEAAVHAARTVGFSWGEIGRVLGVPKQQLHRRFKAPG
jgi:hypothetical protein